MANTCTTLPNGLVSTSPNSPSCTTWSLSTDPAQTMMDGVNAQTLAIAGATINVHKLLGVHEQTKLIDLVGHGTPISGGDAPNYPASNAFTSLKTEWRSRQVGSQLLAEGYIGYDFGYIKLPDGQARYGIDTSVRHQITTIKIKQSKNPNSRVTSARIERSEDGKQWYGTAMITLPNNDSLNTISFKNSSPMRYWRLRPITFVGGACDSWGVQALEMSNWNPTALNNIQDKIFLENRDRDYSGAPIAIKGYYQLPTVQTDLTRFGIEIPTGNYQIQVNFNATVAALGRPIVIGDILELPSEQQYTPELTPVKRYLEVTDVTWDPSTYTPGWFPLMLLVTATQALASEETQDIFGDLAKQVDTSGLFSTDDGNNPMYQDFSDIEQTIKAEALDAVPERGSEGARVVRQFTPEEIAQGASVGANIAGMSYAPTRLYVECALPPNDEPYTTGEVLPAAGVDKQWFRLIYTGVAAGTPARLYRWSAAKNRWIWLETDKREQFNQQKQILDEYLTSPTAISAKKIGQA